MERILLVSGSLRRGSTNTGLLLAARDVMPDGFAGVLYEGMRALPHFDPDDDAEPLDPAVAGLRGAIADARAVVLSTPEYAGGLPGSFKNLLDWTIGDDQPGSIYEKPVAWINASPRSAKHAHDSLRLVLDYAHARVIEGACAHVSVTADDVGPDGLVADPALRADIARAVRRLVDDVRPVGAPGRAGADQSTMAP